MQLMTEFVAFFYGLYEAFKLSMDKLRPTLGFFPLKITESMVSYGVQ